MEPQPEASVHAVVFAAQEAERQRIARELHDGAGQALAALAIGLKGIADSRFLTQAKHQAHELQSLVQRMSKELGYLTRTLYTAHTNGIGFESTVRELCADFATTFGIEVSVAGGSESMRIQQSTHLTAYRILQESLANVARHAHASHVRVSVRATHNSLYLKIADDGRGFKAGEQGTAGICHMGLRTMRDRAELLGGTLTVNSRPSHGTCVRAALPNLPGADEQEVA